MKVYITGHRNPDLDTVCSAMAYAKLKNRLDPKNEYIPVRCGHLSDSIQAILESLSITPPEYMRDVFPKVSDVMLTTSERHDVSEPLSVLAETYKDSNPSVIPVFDGNTYEGLLSVDDITAWFMNSLSKGDEQYIPSLREVMREQEAPIQTSDMFEDAKASLSGSKKRGLSVFDGDSFKGYVTRRCFLKSPSYNVILVDHNEPRQSINGIETANILEIIDHHRLDALKTNLPIFIDAEPLGSTCTIVHQLYLRNHITPDEETARILLTGIIADTLILKSPTTTAIDISSASSLAWIANEDVQTFGINMFSHVESLKTRDPENAILSDFKKYVEKGFNIGIGQLEVTTLQDFDSYKAMYAKALEDVRVKNSLDWAVVMITDVLKEHSRLITTKFRFAKNLPYQVLEEDIMDMPNVMSRKKQLLPEMLSSIMS